MAKRNRETDDKSQRKRNSRLRFKRLVRAVMLNIQFLDETEEQQGISMNVKKNVALLVRQKRKTGLLTVAEKALLRSQHKLRTIEERKRLCLVIAGLSCFVRIPPKIRARLVPALRFMTINADRVIVKEGDHPLFVYFVVSGEIELKKKIFDKSTRKTSLMSEAILGAGDWIGEVEFLEHCPRLNTFVALNTCEILTITDDDFKRILGPFMEKVWIDKKNALKSLSYFDFLTEDQIVRACNISILTQYDPLQSIYSEDGGAISCVHFIMSGECVILQCLKMKVVKLDGKKTFELSSADQSGTLFDSGNALRSLHSNFERVRPQANMFTDSKFVLNDLLASSSDEDDEDVIQEKKALRKMGLRDIEAACGLGRTSHLKRKKRKMKSISVVKRRTTVMPRRRGTSYPAIYLGLHEGDDDDESLEEGLYDYLDEEYVEHEEISTTDSDDESIKKSISLKSTGRKSSRQASTRNSLKPESRRPSIQEPIIIKARIETDDSQNDVEYSTDEESSSSSQSIQFSISKPILPTTETHFIDVGSLTFGSIFGLGEKMAHRVIMARNVVQCLLLPRFWLMEEEQNPGNVWQRRRFYLEGSIPSRETLFGNFLKTRRWEKFKHDYVQSTLNPNSVNSTQPEDIPIICRIVETRDDI